MVALPVEAGGQADALEHGGQQRRVGAGGRRRAHLLVVEQAHDRHRDLDMGRVIGAGRPDQALDRRPARQLVVEAGRRHQRPVDAHHRPGDGVVGHRVPARHRIGGHVEALGQEPPEVALGGLAQAPDRHEVLLVVELQALGGDGPVEVDGQLGDAQHGLVHPERHEVDPARPGPHGHPARQPEVAVQPRVDQGAAVDLDAQLAVAGAARVGAGADAQVGAVGVGADDPHPDQRVGIAGGPPRHQRPTPHHQVRARGDPPGLPLVQTLEPGRFEATGRLLGGVEGRR